MIHVYVFSLGHSGSTILNIALASVPGALSVGEAEVTIRRMHDRQHACTCGAAAAECPLWGALFADEELRRGPEVERGYRLLYDAARATGDVSLLVDSSKHLRALQRRPTDTNVEAKVVFLVKDPRSYFVSHYRKWMRTTAATLGPVRRFLSRIVEIGVALGSWWHGNRKILRVLRAGGFSFIALAYEDLVLDTEQAATRLSDFLDVPVDLTRIGQDRERLHILRGNALRHDPQRSSRLIYDYRWFYDPSVRRLGFVFGPLLRWGIRRGLLPKSR